MTRSGVSSITSNRLQTGSAPARRARRFFEPGSGRPGPSSMILSWPVSQITERRTSPRRPRWLPQCGARVGCVSRQVELEAFALLEDGSSFAVRQELALFQVGEGAAAQGPGRGRRTRRSLFRGGACESAAVSLLRMPLDHVTTYAAGCRALRSDGLAAVSVAQVTRWAHTRSGTRCVSTAHVGFACAMLHDTHGLAAAKARQGEACS